MIDNVEKINFGALNAGQERLKIFTRNVCAKIWG